MAITHAFVSAIAEGADATLVRPSNWNADHTLASGTILSALGGITLNYGASIAFATATNGFMDLYGGTTDAGKGARILAFGATYSVTPSLAGAFIVKTPDLTTTADVTRLTITGNLATAVATWSDVTHTGIKLSGGIDVNGTTWTNTGSTWTIPAVTLGGAVAGGAQVLSNLGTTYIGDTANAKMTLGLTINQGGSGDEILAFKCSLLAHGMTDYTETDTYGCFTKYAEGPTEPGGLRVGGYSAITVALDMWGCGVTDNTLKTTSATAYVVIAACKKSGTGVGLAGTDANLVTIQNQSTTRFIFDAEGSGHADVEWTTYDQHDDLALVADMESELLLCEDDAKTERRHALESCGIIGKDSWHMEKNRPRAMVNFTKLAMLHHGALLQTVSRFESVESRVERLESENKQLLMRLSGLLN